MSHVKVQMGCWYCSSKHSPICSLSRLLRGTCWLVAQCSLVLWVVAGLDKGPRVWTSIPTENSRSCRKNISYTCQSWQNLVWLLVTYTTPGVLITSQSSSGTQGQAVSSLGITVPLEISPQWKIVISDSGHYLFRQSGIRCKLTVFLEVRFLGAIIQKSLEWAAVAPFPRLNKENSSGQTSRHPFPHSNCFQTWPLLLILSPRTLKWEKRAICFQKIQRQMEAPGVHPRPWLGRPSCRSHIYIRISGVLSVPKLAWGFGFDINTSQHPSCDLKGFKEQVCSHTGTETKAVPNTPYVSQANPLFHSSRPLGFHPSCSPKSTLSRPLLMPGTQPTKASTQRPESVHSSEGYRKL